MMPGVRDPQPPSSPMGLSPETSLNQRRRHSLPALSSEDLNRLSTNAAKAKTGSQRKAKTNTKSQSIDSANKSPRTSEEKAKRGSKSSGKSLKPVSKIRVSKEVEDDALEDSTLNEMPRPEDPPAETDEYGILSPVGIRSSTLQRKVQSSKSNAVFIFRFDDDDDGPKKDTPKSSVCPGDPAPSLQQTNFTPVQLSQTWPFESVDERTNFNQQLKQSMRFNTTGFCGYKHKQWRESGKLYRLMTPVQELQTPTDETEIESDDEWSVDTSSDYWTDTRSMRSSIDTNSPKTARSKDGLRKRQSRSVKINANSNHHLTTGDLESRSLRSALALSPRRSSTSDTKPSLTSLREFSQRTRNNQKQSGTPFGNQSPRRTIRRGSLDSTVGQIFYNLKTTPSSIATPPKPTAASKSLSLSSSAQSPTLLSSSPNRLSPGHDDDIIKFKPTSPLPPRLLARRKSLGALPDVASLSDFEDAKSKRRDSISSAKSDPTLTRNSSTKRSTTQQGGIRQAAIVSNAGRRR